MSTKFWFGGTGTWSTTTAHWTDGSNITVSQSGNTITVSNFNGGVYISPGVAIYSGTNLIGKVTALGTGTGGSGTYTVDTSATVSSTVGYFSNIIQFSASRTTTTLTITSAVTGGTLSAGQTVWTSGGVSFTIGAVLSGTGGVGSTYSTSSSGTISNTTMSAAVTSPLVPTLNDEVIFGVESLQSGTSNIITMSGAHAVLMFLAFSAVTIAGTGTLSIGSSNTVTNSYRQIVNIFTLSSSVIYSATGTITLLPYPYTASNLSQTIIVTTNGISLPCSIIVSNGSSSYVGIVKLGSALTIGSTNTFSLTNSYSYLDLAGYSLSCGIFSVTSTSSNGQITSNGSTITLTGTAATILTMSAAFNLTIVDNLNISVASPTTNTRAIAFGATLLANLANKVSIDATSGGGTISLVSSTTAYKSITSKAAFSGTIAFTGSTALQVLQDFNIAGGAVSLGTVPTLYIGSSGASSSSNLQLNLGLLSSPISTVRLSSGCNYKLVGNSTFNIYSTYNSSIFEFNDFTLNSSIISLNGGATTFSFANTGKWFVTSASTTPVSISDYSGSLYFIGLNPTLEILEYNDGVSNVTTSTIALCSSTYTLNLILDQKIGGPTSDTPPIQYISSPTISTNSSVPTVKSLTRTSPPASLDAQYNWSSPALQGNLTVLGDISLTGYGSNTINITSTPSTATNITITNLTPTTSSGISASAATYNGNCTAGNLTISGTGTTKPLTDLYANTLSIKGGTFNGNTKNIYVGSVDITGTTTRTIDFGGSVWNVTGSGTVWTASGATNITLIGNNSTINMSSSSAKTFSGGGLSYPTINQGGIGDLIIDGNNTFTNLSNNLFGTTPITVKFTSGTTNNFYNFSLTGSASAQTILTSTSTSQHTLNSLSSGVFEVGYLTISYSNAIPANKWYAAPTPPAP